MLKQPKEHLREQQKTWIWSWNWNSLIEIGVNEYSKVADIWKNTTDIPQQVYMTHEELHDDNLLQYGGLEFPQINYEEYNGRPYRFFYSCGFGHVFADSLLKMDVHTKELKVSVGDRPDLIVNNNQWHRIKIPPLFLWRWSRQG